MITIKWIFAIVLFIIIWVVIDYHLGKKNHIKRSIRREYPLRHGEMSIFTDGPTLFARFFADIEKAKQTVHILFFIVTEDKTSMDFFTLLVKKARQGTEVRLLLDWVGSRKVSKETVHMLQGAGVKIAFAHRPCFPFLFFTLQQRNHRKITVIDGEVGYIGGFNIGKEYMNLDTVLTPWRDYHLRVIGESVEDLQQEFLVDWKRTTKETFIAEGKFFPPLPTGKVEHLFYPSEGLHLEAAFCQMIDRAKTSIYIGTPYFIPTKKMFDSLLSALKNGIHVTILVPETSDHALVKESSYRFFRPLLEEGAVIYQFLNGFFHAKVIVIDETFCDVGTANFDRRSVVLNHEINCFIYDQTFVKNVRIVLEKDILDSQRLTLEELKKIGWKAKIKAALARLVEGFL